MSTAAAEAKGSLQLFDKKVRKTFSDPLVDNNPITVQVLGVCSALAVTTQVKQALIMGIAVIFCTSLSNLILASIRNFIPNSIRIIVQLAVISVLVIFVDEVLAAYMYDLEKSLSVFIGLIITNCILLGRAEAYAMSNPPWPSFVDGLGNGLGYAVVLLVVGAARELFGAGSLLGFRLIPEAAYAMGYTNNGLMVLAPGAFMLLGLIIWAMRSWTGFEEH